MTKEEAIKHLHTYSSTNGSGLTTQDQHEEAKKMAIKALETQVRWIPCSTALPKDEEEVIVSIHDDSGDYSCDYTSSGWYAVAGEFWVVDNEANMRVVAWMPLPTPYREGGQS